MLVLYSSWSRVAFVDWGLMSTSSGAFLLVFSKRVFYPWASWPPALIIALFAYNQLKNPLMPLFKDFCLNIVYKTWSIIFLTVSNQQTACQPASQPGSLFNQNISQTLNTFDQMHNLLQFDFCNSISQSLYSWHPLRCTFYQLNLNLKSRSDLIKFVVRIQIQTNNLDWK